MKLRSITADLRLLVDIVWLWALLILIDLLQKIRRETREVRDDE